MASPAHALVLSFYSRFSGRIALSVGYGPGLVEIFPFVFEDLCGTPIGIIALAVMVQDDREVVHLYHLGAFIPGSGNGTKMLEELCREANRLCVAISLSPTPCPDGTPPLLDVKALDAWYRRFGFQGDAHLVREPVSSR
ncbi:hypothetical protein [Desulfoluna spongiiphila]|uniref:N-acetyltransferase domain-containing protein n=1 Tax=Desulfoluna spongiiphila TaxID=419481 RepID=A0A1G5HGX6_9BACT|nr:hypothetical protein [Desulfoluna spongiiphila]SCY63122.1 hypothetical protein SAMN05216233_11436 [Desulfoluna spongiiphila]VVS93429.1 hypothetical protein DBB_30010 [Desulfoluna spongiiphila]